MSEAAAAPGFSRWLSDERLTRRACGGDERAFAAIFRRYHQPLYRFCLAIVGNPEDAQDALQATMVKVLRALPGEERAIELKPWLYRIAHNEAIDLLRRRRETRQLDAEQPSPGGGLAEDAATRERLRRLLADLGELPERQREVLVMRELSGLGFGEIGAALGTSGAVARQTLYEARQSLRQMDAGREMRCGEVTRALSDGDGRVTRRRDILAHLRSCAECRAFRDEIEGRRRDLAAISPLPAAAVAVMVQGLAGGSGAASGGGLAAAIGGGAAKTIGASAAAKGVATVAVAAAVGVGAADRTGVIQLGLPGEGGSQPARSAPASGGSGSVDRGSAAAGAPAAASPGRSGGKAGADDPPSASAAGSNGMAPAPGQGAENPAPPERGHGYGHGKEGAAAQAPGPPASHEVGRGHEKQPSSAAGQEKAAGKRAVKDEKKAAKDESGSRGKSESAHAERAPEPERAPPTNSPPGQAEKEPPANPPPAVPESPDQAPPQTSPGKGPEPAAPGSEAGGKGPA